MLQDVGTWNLMSLDLAHQVGVLNVVSLVLFDFAKSHFVVVWSCVTV